MEILGYMAAALIGISLGLVGGGGSILTVPVLVYLFNIEPTLATAYSLFIVGTTALVGGIQSAIKRSIDFKTALVFAIPSLVAVFLTRRFLVPLIPDQIAQIGEVLISRDIAIMIFFAIIMIAASISMIKDKHKETDDKETPKYNYRMIMAEGAIVGILTGIVGAGGGFLIIPALVLFARLSMKKAVGTSLIIIAAKSLMGFLGDVGSGQPIDFPFILKVSIVAVAGIFIGNYLSKYIGGSRLKRLFGFFVLIMSFCIILKEILL